MTEPFALWQIALIARTAIPISIQKMDHSRQKYAPQKPARRSGGIPGQAAPTRLYQIISGLYKLLRRIDGKLVKLPNPKYIAKPYEKMQYPGQRVQIDVNYVPSACLAGDAAGEKYYQYTFIDEYSRFRYLEAFKEQSTYSSTQFIKHVVEKFPYAIECVQTDNGFEFTNEMGNSKKKPLTLFEKTLAQLGIQHKKIRPFTPRHNGKVERSHRKDNEEFYACHTFYSFEDLARQLAVRQRQYNNFPMRPLNWLSPKTVLSAFPNV